MPSLLIFVTDIYLHYVFANKKTQLIPLQKIQENNDSTILCNIKLSKKFSLINQLRVSWKQGT